MDRRDDGGMRMQKISVNLWFDDKAEEAVDFYIQTFGDARKLNTAYYGKAGAKASGRKEGSVMTISFILEGQKFMALNGGPTFTFSPAISLIVNCDTQKEIDHYWDKLSEGGRQDVCGWLTDRYGVSWQIVPRVLDVMMTDKDTVKVERVMAALLQMKKLEINKLKKAYKGGG